MIWLLKVGAIRLLTAIVLIVAAHVLFALPAVTGRIHTTALPPPPTGPLASRAACDRPVLTDNVVLRGGANAVAARILLADAAISSIDV